MDDSNLQGQLTQAKAGIASAEANLQKLLAGNRPQDIIQSQAQLEEAQANLNKLLAGNEFDLGQKANALVVPTVAVVREQRGTGVYILNKENQPVFIPITVGVTANNKTEVKSGLKADEKVLLTLPIENKPKAGGLLTPPKPERHGIQPPVTDDFRITNQADILNTLTSVVGLLTIMVGAIAAIYLIVGGIGITNIMLVSVVERTREIGIRKAVGATNTAILSQFLVEAIIISCVGGTIGIIGGVVIAFGAATVFQYPFIVSSTSIISGFGLSAAVGLLAGVIPAQNAAKLDPITALRSD